ncbi:ABC transporter permease [Agromyces sp. Soil535]|uniref:ABC transporter permease n=1 Tax=Agromyces sp. Soil535 TaxID=1736390 RepID=UPI000700AF6E|nr:ABC transporter permease [Agromyces sp. Soil535]KRE21749.1 permease [Agromyces sp. Soil535]
MKTLDLIGSAIGNTFRSKTRTILTILAIFVGAFTLTITNGLGTGINRYIDDTVAAIGADDVMTVTKVADNASDDADGPREYDPDAISGGPVAGPPGSTAVVAPIGTTQLDELAAIEGVERVQPTKTIDADYITSDDGMKYEIGVGGFVNGMQLQLAAGEQPDAAASESQVVIPDSYVDALGFDDADAAIGETVTLAVTDSEGVQHELEATVVGVAEASLGTTSSAVPNDAFGDALFDAQSTGLDASERDAFSEATVWFDADSTEEEITALQDRLADAGYDSTTVTEQLGTFKAVIDGIVLVLNAFAIIALLAASFGIVNTLLMSVQERTREIGLMKAMGMGSGKVFGLFSLEAVFIGFLGSAIGAGLGMLVGTAVSSALGGALLADLPGLTLIAFDPVSIAVIILVVMGVAFLAGTLPAARAARQDPVESLRYE